MLNRLTFDHKNEPSYFQRVTSEVVNEPDVVVVYLDDVVIFGEDSEIV